MIIFPCREDWGQFSRASAPTLPTSVGRWDGIPLRHHRLHKRWDRLFPPSYTAWDSQISSWAVSNLDLWWGRIQVLMHHRGWRRKKHVLDEFSTMFLTWFSRKKKVAWLSHIGLTNCLQTWISNFSPNCFPITIQYLTVAELNLTFV